MGPLLVDQNYQNWKSKAIAGMIVKKISTLKYPFLSAGDYVFFS